MRWTSADLPDLTGRTFIVTGGNSGIGFEAARALAKKSATVVIACRSVGKGEEAKATILGESPTAQVEVSQLDLASLSSIRAFATAWGKRPIDVLINNAGIMAVPFSKTEDGFESQFGTNHLGHFALTGLLLPNIRPQGRVVNVASGAHRLGTVQFDRLNDETTYHPWKQYGLSKLANLLFTFELNRRLNESGSQVAAVACHPGYASTPLTGAKLASSGLRERFFSFGDRLFAQPAEMGALPTIYAATHELVNGGDYIGPNGWFELWGHPVKVDCAPKAKDPKVAHELWTVSATLTGVQFLDVQQAA